MESSGYYYSPYQYQPAPFYYNHSPQQQRASSVSAFLFLATLSLLVATTLISLCESAVETLVHQLRGFVILSPLLVVITVQLWVSSGGGLESLIAELVTGDQREEQHYYRYRGGGGGSGSSPWGVALALALVLCLVTYQPSIHERWFWPVAAAVFTVVGVVHVSRIRFNS